MISEAFVSVSRMHLLLLSCQSGAATTAAALEWSRGAKNKCKWVRRYDGKPRSYTEKSVKHARSLPIDTQPAIDGIVTALPLLSD